MFSAVRRLVLPSLRMESCWQTGATWQFWREDGICPCLLEVFLSLFYEMNLVFLLKKVMAPYER
jgi:hypothetical protein